MLKKLFFGIIIVILIIAGVYTANKISKKGQTVKTGTNIIKNTVKKTDEENVIENNVEINETENSTVENNVSKTENPEEQAKKIVINNWGEDDSVYYSYDGLDSQGRYIICVRDKATTKALFWYYVDIESGTFDIE